MFRRLGFRVLPLMEHVEVGTSNTVVQFQDTYLELIGDADRCRNPELRESLRRRLGHGDGFYMTSFTSSGLEADRPVMQAAGVKLGPIQSARRRVRMPDCGWMETDSRSMYAWNTARPLMSMFVTDHRKPEVIWIPAYMNHPNTVERVTGVSYTAEAPLADVEYISGLIGFGPSQATARRVLFETPRGERLEILDRAGCAERFGKLAPVGLDDLAAGGVALCLQIADLDRCRWVLRDGGVPFEEEGGRLRVGAPHACGVVLEFQVGA